MHPQPSFALVRGDERFSREQLEVTAREMRNSIASGSAIRLYDASTDQLIQAIIGLDGHCRRIELVPEGVQLEPLDDEFQSFDSPTEWVIYTSGSTGTPKAVVHTLESLSRAVSESDGPRVWGLVYDSHRLAGLAVVLQALASDSLLVEARNGTITDRVEVMRATSVNALSATPTLWRQILQTGRTSGWELERITLGGEISDQRTLDALAAAFPTARVTHIFAASETGVAFAVGDGREGFPLEYLSTPPRGIALEVRDNILWIHNPSSSVAGADGFASTEDVVKVSADRVTFVGRASGMVNVGGTKVFPEQVERVLRTHPSVTDVVVFSKQNPFSGSILIAKVTLRGGLSDESIAGELRKWVAAKLPTPMVPAQVLVVDQLPSAATGKVVRS